MGTVRRSQEEIARRERIQELLNSFEIEGLGGLRKFFFSQMLGTFLESGLNAEMSEQLGYDRYERKPESVQNSRNGYGRKQL